MLPLPLMEMDRTARTIAAEPHLDANGADDAGVARAARPTPAARRGRRWSPRPPLFGLLCLLLAAPLALAALWPRAPFALDVGSPGDRLFLGNVHGDERTAEYTYRWTGRRGEPATLAVPGWGAVRRARLAVRAQALPGQGPVELRVRAGDATLATLTIGEAMGTATAEIALPASAGGELTLVLDAPTRQVAGDGRPLGVKLDRVALTPLAREGGAFWRAVWGPLALALALVAALQVAIGGAAGRLALAGRVGAALGLPLALALALPWALALLPVGLGAAVAIAVLRWRARLLGWLADGWAALDRPRAATIVVAAGSVAYAAVLLPHILAVPWISHADYADNAVVARNLVQGRGFTVDYVAQFYRDWPALRHPAETWPPLQPIMIAAAFFLFGVSVGVAKLPNLLIMLGLIWLVYRVGRWLWSPRVGVLAALLVALHPAFVDGVAYPLNDVVFALLALGCLALIALLAPPAPGDEEGDAAATGWRRLGGWALLGVLGGLLLLAKPSGLLLLAGGGAWLLWRGWRAGRLRPVLIAGLGAAALALAVYSPWLVRNQLTFGQPFYSTESYDAYLLEYRDWETIYQVYAGRQPLPHRSLLVGYGLDAVADKIGAQFRESWRDLIGGQIVPVFLLPLTAIGALVAGAGRRRAALAAIAAATVAYVLFVFVYWHYELRYALYLVPPAMLLGAAGLGWLHDRLAEARGRALALVVSLALVAAILVPQWQTLRVDWVGARRVPNSVVVAEWIRDNTAGDAVVMTRNPWELSFQSERLSVMIPADDLTTIRAIAAKYGATYLQLDRLNDPRTRRLALDPLYNGPDEWQGFRKVFDRRGPDGEGLLVYRFP